MSKPFKLPGLASLIRLTVLSMSLMLCGQAAAEPFVKPGDIWLRHDIQRLSDAGIIRSPVTAWPISVGDVIRGLGAIDPDSIDDFALRGALLRLQAYMSRHTEIGVVNWEGAIRLTERVQRVQTFADTARGRQELSFGANYTGERVAVNLEASYEEGDPTDGKALRLDGSYASIALGNWIVSAGLARSLLGTWLEQLASFVQQCTAHTSGNRTA